MRIKRIGGRFNSAVSSMDVERRNTTHGPGQKKIPFSRAAQSVNDPIDTSDYNPDRLNRPSSCPMTARPRNAPRDPHHQNTRPSRPNPHPSVAAILRGKRPDPRKMIIACPPQLSQTPHSASPSSALFLRVESVWIPIAFFRSTPKAYEKKRVRINIFLSVENKEISLR